MYTDQFILATDSYKLNHWAQYPKGTESVYSYFESRDGAQYPETIFFGLQYILKHYFEGQAFQPFDIEDAQNLAMAHFGADLFNRDGWLYIDKVHQGRLPLRIKAVPEGMPVPTGNVLMTVENTDPNCYWLTNAVESLLTHVWYPSTVATLSYHTKKLIKGYLDNTADTDAGLRFMLHDFGYRGASSHESAAIGGAGHLLNFYGTDTLPAMGMALDYYDANLNDLAFSVPATEHSVMTSLGPDGEIEILDNLLNQYPNGILSVVSDSYDIFHFVNEVIARKDQILARDGVFVVRPDSGDPASVSETVVSMLSKGIGYTVNSKGYKVLDPHVRVLWGDGIDPKGIGQILNTLQEFGFSAENMVFGMGGGLLQKVNRDTQRFAFKCSAQKREGAWHDVSKHPVHGGKASKAGRLVLVKNHENKMVTIRQAGVDPKDDLLETVFENGKITKTYTFDEVRKNAGF